MFDFDLVNRTFQGEFDALRFEVDKLADLFRANSFYDDPWRFRHAHYGYVMACMGRVDQYSAFWKGTSKNQTQRMIDFLANFVYPLPQFERVHSVAVQMFRHSLMHTGAVRPLFDRRERIAYTWRVQFGKLPDGVDHYMLTKIDQAHHKDLLLPPIPDGRELKEIWAINISIPLLVTGLYQGVSRYMIKLRNSANLQENYVRTVPGLAFQTFRLRIPSGEEGAERQ